MGSAEGTESEVGTEEEAQLVQWEGRHLEQLGWHSCWLECSDNKQQLELVAAAECIDC